jgi:dihydroorotate dehydrogenase
MLSGASSGIVSSNGTNSMSGSNTTAVTSTNTGGLVTPILNPISLGRRAIKY